jgi:hypothetical protein
MPVGSAPLTLLNAEHIATTVQDCGEMCEGYTGKRSLPERPPGSCTALPWRSDPSVKTSTKYRKRDQHSHDRKDDGEDERQDLYPNLICSGVSLVPTRLSPFRMIGCSQA